MLFLAQHGFRVIAHDRRGHGRSTQTWNGNDMDTYADDLAALIEALDLQDVTLVGYSTGGGEVARYIGRHGTGRVAKAVLVSAVPPFMLRPTTTPTACRSRCSTASAPASLADRSQTYRDLADGPFFGANRPGANVSQGMRDAVLAAGHAVRAQNAYECIAAFSATDFSEDLEQLRRPDAGDPRRRRPGRPLRGLGGKSARLIKGAKLSTTPARRTASPTPTRTRLNADLLTSCGADMRLHHARRESDHELHHTDTIVLIHGFWVTPRAGRTGSPTTRRRVSTCSRRRTRDSRSRSRR